jgi:hypothetical protein
MNQAFLKNPCLRSDSLALGLLLGCALLFHWYGQWEWIYQPLFNDEQYYASPLVLSRGIFSWPLYSFGHPPGWPFLNWIMFQLFGASAVVARAVGLAASTGFLFVLPWLLYRSAGILPAAIFLLGIFGNGYFQDFSAHNHPIIATSLFGFAALFFFAHSRYLAFLFSIIFAILIRESSLVFLLAALLLRPQKTTLKLIAPPILLLGLSYGWSFFLLNKAPVNPQMEAVFNSGQSIFIFTLPKILHFYQTLLLLNGWPFAISLILGVAAFFYRGGQAKSPRILLALLAVFLVDSIFFALYRDSDSRNFFISSVALWLFSSINIGNFIRERFFFFSSRYVLPAFLVGLIFLFPQAENANLLEQKETALAIRKLALKIQELKESNSTIDIVSTNPFTYYFNEPYMGYVPTGLKIRWHGGMTGTTQIQNPDGIVLPLSGYENPITEEMKRFIQAHSDHYELQQVESVPIRQVSLALYVRKKLQ